MTTKKSTTRKTTATKTTTASKKKAETKKVVKPVKSDAHIPVDLKPVPKGVPAKKLTVALQDRVALAEEMNKKKGTKVAEKKRITITLTENQAEALKVLAKAHKCTIGDLVGNDLLIMYLCNSAEDMKFMGLHHHDLVEQVIIGN